MYHFVGTLGVDPAAEVVAADADDRNHQPGVAEATEAHVSHVRDPISGTSHDHRNLPEVGWGSGLHRRLAGCRFRAAARSRPGVEGAKRPSGGPDTGRPSGRGSRASGGAPSTQYARRVSANRAIDDILQRAAAGGRISPDEALRRSTP